MSRQKIPELSIAVLRVREAAGDSQEIFARRLGTTATSISRIERGQQTPASFDVLNRLEKMARDLELTDEAALFDEARSKVRFNAYKAPGLADEPTFSLPVWRLTIAARIAAAYFPERLPAIEEALRPAVDIVDEVLRSIDDESEIDYSRMEREVFSRAERRTLQYLRREVSTSAMKEE
jgi:transcriptional regulator with XRE-family HTH domain